MTDLEITELIEFLKKDIKMAIINVLPAFKTIEECVSMLRRDKEDIKDTQI